MKNTLKILTAFFALIVIAASIPLSANAAVMIEEDNAIISGVIVSVDGEILILNAENRVFNVDIDDIDLEVEANKILIPSMVVAVEGAIEDEDDGIVYVDAKKLIMVNANMSEESAINMLVEGRKLDD